MGAAASRRPSRGRLRFLAWLPLPIVVIGGSLITYVGQADRDDTGAVVDAGTLAAYELRVGDCFDDGELGDEDIIEVENVAATPCDQPHDNEVFHSYELAGDALPSDEVVMEQAGAVCVEEFDAFVGVVYEESELDFFPMWPTQGAWDQGDRTVTCALYSFDGTKLTGSARGAGR